MKHPDPTLFPILLAQIQNALSNNNGVDIRELYQLVRQYAEYNTLKLMLATNISEQLLTSQQHEAALAVLNEALDGYSDSPGFGSNELQQQVQHDLFMVQIRILACYKDAESDHAILALTSASLEKHPHIWRTGEPFHWLFYATQAASALVRIGKYEEAATLYLKLQQVGQEENEVMLENIAILGWAQAILFIGKREFSDGNVEGARTMWLSARKVWHEWKSNISPADDYDPDYLQMQFLLSAYTDWLTGQHQKAILIRHYQLAPIGVRKEMMVLVQKEPISYDSEISLTMTEVNKSDTSGGRLN